MDWKLKSRPRRTIETLALALVAAGSVCAGSASATTVTYQVNNGGLVSGFDLKIDSTAINGALAGGILINQVTSNPSMPKSYTTVCTDIEGVLYLGQDYKYNTPVTAFSAQTTGEAPTWGAVNTPGYLAGNHGAVDTANAEQAIQNAAYLFYNFGNLTSTGIHFNGSKSQQEVDEAALQLAVWDALYDTTASGKVNGTRFNATAPGYDTLAQEAITQANLWIADLNALSNDGNFGLPGYLLTPASGANSYYCGGTPPQGLLIAVPEAPTVIASALLLLPFAASAVKILRKKRTA